MSLRTTFELTSLARKSRVELRSISCSSEKAKSIRRVYSVLVDVGGSAGTFGLLRLGWRLGAGVAAAWRGWGVTTDTCAGSSMSGSCAGSSACVSVSAGASATAALLLSDDLAAGAGGAAGAGAAAAVVSAGDLVATGAMRRTGGGGAGGACTRWRWEKGRGPEDPGMVATIPIPTPA